MNGIIWSPKTLYWAWTIICMPKMNIMMPLTWTCAGSCHRDTADDGFMKTWRRVDAVDAISS